MEEKKKHEAASPQKLAELQHLDLESFYKQQIGRASCRERV